jgi:hypothetical protein
MWWDNLCSFDNGYLVDLFDIFPLLAVFVHSFFLSFGKFWNVHYEAGLVLGAINTAQTWRSHSNGGRQ